MNPNENLIANNYVPPVAPVPPVMSTPPFSPVSVNNHKKVGPIIAILVIVLVLIIAALYLFASNINQQTAPINIENTPIADTFAINNETATAGQSVQAVTNTSDDLQSLQDDLNVSTNGLDSQNF